MKEFERFPHEGVRSELEQIQKHFARDPEIAFGSSGEGQLTISSPKRTAYVRRYKRRDGWNAAVTRGPERFHPTADFSTKSELLAFLEKMLLPSYYAPLADTVSQDLGLSTKQIMLLRHASEDIRALLRHGGTIEEYTALQPVDSRYDFLSAKHGPVRVVVVIVHDRVYEVFEVNGVEVEGTTYRLASAAYHAFNLARNRGERPARRFNLVPLTNRVLGQPIRGWEGGRTRTTVQRWNEGFFREIKVELPAEAEHDTAARLREDLEAALSEAGAPETARTALAQARIGQGRFRRALMAHWEGACAVSGCDVEEALRASHCKPWSEASNAERLDAANGLLLVATLDALFDAGLIAFSDDGQMLLHDSLTPERRRALGIEIAALRVPPNLSQREFLRYHRENIFRGAAVG